VDLSALYNLARNPVDGLISKLERENTAPAFKVFRDSAADMLVLLPGTMNV
jgi:hypothetical protein